MKKITEKQFFYISEFQQEAAWLSLMHQEGWKLYSLKGHKYEFEKCEKEDWIYQLDFKKDGLATDDYIQLYSDFGWELVFKHNKWFYFRKKREAVQERDLTIFTDNESKMEMCNRILTGHFYKIIPLALILLIYSYLLFQTSIFNTSDGLFSLLKIFLFTGMLIGVGVYSAHISRLYKIVKK